jgi:hypothetical protein
LFKTCTSPFQEGLRLYWRQKMAQHHISKESVEYLQCFHYFALHL